MRLIRGTQADFPEVVALANLAYRGVEGAAANWNVETGIIDGPRLTESALGQDLVAKPHASLLLYRETGDGALLGTVWLEPRPGDAWCLGLLTVHPGVQNRQLGRALLAAAEEFARVRGALRIRMTVLQVRESLIAWYGRRGYSRTGGIEPYPYGDGRFGRPLRNDLHFVVLEKWLSA